MNVRPPNAHIVPAVASRTIADEPPARTVVASSCHSRERPHSAERALPPPGSPQHRLLRLDFSRPLQVWDGFGFNYVEASQVRAYAEAPQDYGGLSLLSEASRQRVLDLVFGEDGLQPALLKMFLDPWHQAGPEAPYDHRATTHWMRWFAREGARRLRAGGCDLRVLTTLYGPPAWMTRQGFVRGRDLAPRHYASLAAYVADWARFLRTEERLKVAAVSLHNEGEDWSRWPEDGATAGDDVHDYNLYWPPEQLTALLPTVRAALDRVGLSDVRLSPGETTNWRRFHTWGYADALAADPAALASLGLVTSHGFHSAGMHRWSADHRSTGIDLLRQHRPDLHAWTTSTGWGTTFGMLVWEAELNIYSAKVNGFIPWAGVQHHRQWAGGDPNPNCAIQVLDDGSIQVNPEYHVYRHLCRAGRPGMRVATVSCNDSEIVPVAFARGASDSPDAAVIANVSEEAKRLCIAVDGDDRFRAFRTTIDHPCEELGELKLRNGLVLPAQSVTRFHRPH